MSDTPTPSRSGRGRGWLIALVIAVAALAGGVFLLVTAANAIRREYFGDSKPAPPPISDNVPDAPAPDNSVTTPPPPRQPLPPGGAAPSPSGSP